MLYENWIDGEKIVKFNEELFIDVTEMIEDVKDICLELEDKGFSIKSGFDVAHIPFIPSCIIITKRCNSEFDVFGYDEVREVIDRLKDYLDNKFLSLWVLGNSNHSQYLRMDGNSGLEAMDEYKPEMLNKIVAVKLKYDVIE